MANLLEAIKNVALAVLGSREDSTPFTQVIDFNEYVAANKTDLSPKAIEELLAGRNDADAYQESFERVVAKQTQLDIQPKYRAARTEQSQTPSQYRIAKKTRTSIVTGETFRPEPDDDDKEPEITLGQKH